MPTPSGHVITSVSPGHVIAHAGHVIRSGRISALHVVDLVGTAPLASASPTAVSPRDYERRCLSQHLLCFNRVVSELAQMEAGTDGSARRRRDLTLQPSQIHRF